jgi:hypothetical protein
MNSFSVRWIRARVLLGWCALLGSLVLLACGSETLTQQEPEEEELEEIPGAQPEVEPVDLSQRDSVSDAILLDSIHLVHTAEGVVSRDQAILVEDGRIVRVAAAGSIDAPGAERPDVSGAWVTPGLFDMHVHVRPDEAAAYVWSGITTVRNMWGYPALEALADSIEAGERTGPRIHSLSSGIDGPPVYFPFTQLVEDPAQADSVVGAMQALGYSEIKVYEDLSSAVYDSLVAATSRRGMTHAGHKPASVPVERVIRSGQRSIEHLGGFTGRSRSELDRLISLAVENGTWLSPTLAVLQTPGDESGRSARRDVVAALYAGGARLLIGTDAGVDRTAVGTSLVDEMQFFATAGVPIRRMLRMITVEAAEYLGVDDDRGRLESGYRADLALFDENPLEDLEHLRSVRAVFMNERLITPGSD